MGMALSPQPQTELVHYASKVMTNLDSPAANWATSLPRSGAISRSLELAGSCCCLCRFYSHHISTPPHDQRAEGCSRMRPAVESEGWWTTEIDRLDIIMQVVWRGWSVRNRRRAGLVQGSGVSRVMLRVCPCLEVCAAK